MSMPRIPEGRSRQDRSWRDRDRQDRNWESERQVRIDRLGAAADHPDANFAELARLQTAMGEAAFVAGKYSAAAALLDEITTAPEFATFLTLAAYRELA